MNAACPHHTPAIVLNNLTVSYRGHSALHHISGQFAPGSLTAVVGPNGSGKSTLLKSIMGLLPRQSGRAGGGLQVQACAQPVAYLPQISDIDRGFPMDVLDCVLLGGWGHTGAFGGVGPVLLARAHSALATVGLQGFEHRPLGTLSSGQFQRVLFARLVLQDARTVLLDEPFSAVDSKTTALLLALVQQWHAQGRTVIAVLHDDVQILEVFPQTLLLARELVAWGPTADVMTAPQLQRARAMAEAWDDTAELCEVDA